MNEVMVVVQVTTEEREQSWHQNDGQSEHRKRGLDLSSSEFGVILSFLWWCGGDDAESFLSGWVWTFCLSICPLQFRLRHVDYYPNCTQSFAASTTLYQCFSFRRILVLSTLLGILVKILRFKWELRNVTQRAT